MIVMALLGVFSLGATSCSSEGSETSAASASSSIAPDPDAAETSTSTEAPPPETTPEPDPTTTTTTEPVPVPCPAPVSAVAEIPAGVVAEFDLEADQVPEGVTVDESGNVFVSIALHGQLLRFAPGSNEYEVFGSIPDWTVDGYGFLGLAADGEGNVYGAVHSASSPGVWRFDCNTGEASLVPGTAEMTFPNSLAFDPAGNLFISDSFSGMDGTDPLGAIWRVRPDGAAQKWLESTTLGGTGVYDLLTPVGANGIAVHDDTVYVANTEKGLLFAIPILEDGTAGETSIIAGGAELIAPDGITMDSDGGIYVAVISQNAVKRVNPDGSIDTIAVGFDDGLDFPASVAFGPGGDGATTLYAVNLLFGGLSVTGVGPALVAITVEPTTP